jgi:hypothetical protein
LSELGEVIVAHARNVRNMNPEKAQELSPELRTALEPFNRVAE